MGRTKGSKTMTPTVRGLIVAEALQNRQKPRRALAVELMTTIERMGEVVPSEETVARLISEARNHEPNPQDGVWSIFSLEQYPIPPEAIPSVLEVYFNAIKEDRNLTIRQAKWATRLYAVIKDTHVLFVVARNYALAEQIREIVRGPVIRPKTAHIVLGLLAKGRIFDPEFLRQLLEYDLLSFLEEGARSISPEFMKCLDETLEEGQTAGQWLEKAISEKVDASNTSAVMAAKRKEAHHERSHRKEG